MSFLSRERFKLHPAEATQPKYEHLKSFVLAELGSGNLKSGDVLPSEPKLADSLKVGRSTVRQALRELEREGIVERIKGQGTFIRDTSKKEVVEQPVSLDAFAIVVPETPGGTFYSPLVSSFEKACNSIHNEMIVRSTSNSPGLQADAIIALIDKKVGGIAMVPTSLATTPPYQIRLLQQQGVPVVFCHRGVEGINAPIVKIDYKQIGRMAGEQFLRHGHKRIVRLGWLSDDTCPSTIGYELGLQEVGIELDEELVYRISDEDIPLPVFRYEESLQEWLKDICSRKDRPTAIFAPFDPIAEMAVLLLGDMGIRVPEEMSVLSFGPKWRTMPGTRRLSAVVVDSIQMGQKACKLLAEMRNGQRPIDSGEQFNIDSEFWEGVTLGPIPADKAKQRTLT